MKGEQVTDLERLDELSLARRAVVCARFGGRPLPATVMMNQKARVLLRVFRSGMWVYEKESKGDKDNE